MKKISQRQIRELIIFFIYRQLLLNKNYDQSIQELIDQSNVIFDEQTIRKITSILQLKEELIKIINPKTKDNWNFNKFSNLEKSILIVCTYEITYQKIPKAIIIDQAIKISKKYLLDNEYKYINGILESVSLNEWNKDL